MLDVGVIPAQRLSLVSETYRNPVRRSLPEEIRFTHERRMVEWGAQDSKEELIEAACNVMEGHLIDVFDQISDGEMTFTEGCQRLLKLVAV
jgi:hypothetical protein